MDPFDSPFGEIEQNDFSSWDLDTDVSPPRMREPGSLLLTQPMGLEQDSGLQNAFPVGGQERGRPEVAQAHVSSAEKKRPAPATPAPDTASVAPNPSSSDKARRITVWNRTTKRKVLLVNRTIPGGLWIVLGLGKRRPDGEEPPRVPSQAPRLRALYRARPLLNYRRGLASRVIWCMNPCESCPETIAHSGAESHSYLEQA